MSFLFRDAVRFPSESYFGARSEDFIMDQLDCTGNEASVRLCGRNPWGSHDCKTNEIAGVVCLQGKKCVRQQIWYHF